MCVGGTPCVMEGTNDSWDSMLDGKPQPHLWCVICSVTRTTRDDACNGLVVGLGGPG